MSTGSKKHKAEPTPIYIKQEARLKQDRLIAMVPGEVGWFGVVNDEDSDFIIIEDIIVPKQKVTGASVDYDAAGIESLMDEHSDVIHKVKYFGHSHYTMDSYFSSIDIDDFIKPMSETGIDYFICHVENKEGKSETRIDQFKPIRIEDKECELITLIPGDIVDWAQEQVKDKVTVEKTATPKWTKSNNNSTKVVHSRQDVPKKGRAVWIDSLNTRREYVDGRLVAESTYEEDTKLLEERNVADPKGKQVGDEYIPVDIEDEEEFFGELEEEVYTNKFNLGQLHWYDESW